jgi:hypothetical protein
VGNYYTRNSSFDNTVVTVSKPRDEFLTGGGYLVLTNSSGIRAGDAGTSNNIGFFVKPDDDDDDPYGKINTIVRSGGRVYQVKGSSMTSLSVQESGATGGSANFKGKASIQDITEPLAPVSIDGNATVRVQLDDLGVPGTSDSIAIAIWNRSGELWFASNWTGSKMVKQALDGGDIEVRGHAGKGIAQAALAFEAEATPTREAVPLRFALPQNFPNPFSASTTLRFELPERSRVTLTVYDLMGREVASLVNGEFEPGYHVATWSGRSEEGHSLGAGVYFVRMIATSLAGSNGLRTDRRVMLVK